MIELKQWSAATRWEDDPSLARIDAYGRRPVLHAIEQVRGYCDYLVQFTRALHDLPGAVVGPRQRGTDLRPSPALGSPHPYGTSRTTFVRPRPLVHDVVPPAGVWARAGA